MLFGIDGTAASLRLPELARLLRREGIAVGAVLGRGAERYLTEESIGESDPPLQLDSINLLLLAPLSKGLIEEMGKPPSQDVLLQLAVRSAAICTAIVPDVTRAEWQSAPFQQAITELRARRVVVFGPEATELPEGAEDTSGLFEAELLSAFVRAIVGRQIGDLRGKRIVISAGGNKESIDSVRWISNRSSGKQGHAIAEAARDRGAIVTLVTCAPESAPKALERVVAVESHAQLRNALEQVVDSADAYIAAAAVADFTPTELVAGKMHRAAGQSATVTLRPTEDILANLPNRPGFVKVAFAAEAEGSAEANQAKALAKLARKGAAMIVLNDVLAPDAGFGKETNRITIIEANGAVCSYPKHGEVALAKYDVAHIVLDHLLRAF